MQIPIGTPGDEECPHGGHATPGGGPMRGSWAGRGRRSARIGAEVGPVRPAIGPQLGQMHVFGPFAARERAKDMLWGHLWPSCRPGPAPKGSSAGGCPFRPLTKGACAGECTLSTCAWRTCGSVADQTWLPLPRSLSRLPLIDPHSGRGLDACTHGSTPGLPPTTRRPFSSRTAVANVHQASVGGGQDGGRAGGRSHVAGASPTSAVLASGPPPRPSPNGGREPQLNGAQCSWMITPRMFRPLSRSS
jgi:hypothetical protein